MTGTTRYGPNTSRTTEETLVPELRLPNYIIIGMMKSGTSSLYNWLASQPECSPARHKEINFFSRDDLWARGVDWYSTFFSDAAPGTLVGEASTSYTKAAAPRAAPRMAATVPDVRLLYLLRHPVDRLRSQYRHEVRRSREQRPLVDALRDPTNPYMALSRYYERLVPYTETFSREQLCIVRLEDLTAPGAPGWAAVLRHLGLEPRAVPTRAHNVTAEKPHFTPFMLRLWQLRSYDRIVRRLPRSVRRVGRKALLRGGPQYDERLAASQAPIPEEILEPVWEDVRRLEAWMGTTSPLWDSTDQAGETDSTASVLADDDE